MRQKLIHISMCKQNNPFRLEVILMNEYKPMILSHLTDKFVKTIPEVTIDRLDYSCQKQNREIDDGTLKVFKRITVLTQK